MCLEICKKQGVLGVKIVGETFQSRNVATAWCISEADKVYNWPDFDTVRVNTTDKGSGGSGGLSYCSHTGEATIPDFIFCCWPETDLLDYDETVHAIERAGSVRAAERRAGWLGNMYTNYARKVMIDLGSTKPHLCDFRHVMASTDDQFLSLEQLVAKYEVLLDIEGIGYSGRLKLLLWSQRPVLVVDRPYQEYFSKLLQPWVHFVPVQRDLTDLLDRVQWCIDNPSHAAAIAARALQFAKQHLTRAAAYQVWNDRLMNIY